MMPGKKGESFRNMIGKSTVHSSVGNVYDDFGKQGILLSRLQHSHKKPASNQEAGKSNNLKLSFPWK